MPGINRIPYGLLGLTGLQSLGESPSTLGDTVTPIVDVLPFWLGSGTQMIRGTAAIAATGFLDPTAGDSFTVPAGELWIVTAYTVRVVSDVGDSVTSTPVVRGPPNDGAFFAPVSTYQATISGQERVLPLLSPGTFVACPAGWRMGLHIAAVTIAIGPTAVFNARYVSVPI